MKKRLIETEKEIYFLEVERDLIEFLLEQGCPYQHRWSSGGVDFYDTPKLRELIIEYQETHRGSKTNG